jgi:hypothetical protein
VDIAQGLAALAAWLGASVIVLADGRRGLAAGLGLTTAALAFLVWPSAGAPAAVAIFAGGGIAAWMRIRGGPPAWSLMPAGSTPRLILCVAGGLLALWISASVTGGSGAPERFAVISVVGLLAGRAISAREPAVILAAVAALVLAIAEGASAADGSVGAATCFAAAAIAAGIMFVPLPAPNAA